MTQEEIFDLAGVSDPEKKYTGNINKDSFFGFPMEPMVCAEKNLLSPTEHSIAYFSMEFGLAPSIYNAFKSKNPLSGKNLVRHHEVFSNMRSMDYYHVLPFEKMLDLPIYSGGLGVLAGDALKSAADTATSLVGIGILWHKGYFNQKFWFKYGQVPEETRWDPHTYPGLVLLDKTASVLFGGEEVRLRLWKYPVYSHNRENVVPLILLDSNCPENSPATRQITDQLYRSDNIWWKIVQRVVLGIGGMKAIKSLGYSINTFHLNEGHAAFAFLEKAVNTSPEEQENLKNRFTYTCHTPVEAGHDRFPFNDLVPLLGEKEIRLLQKYGSDPGDSSLANLTRLAMNTSSHINAVAKKHGEITRLQFPSYREKIQAVTNGVHTYTWVSDSFSRLFDKYSDRIGEWRKNPVVLKNTVSLRNDTGFRKDIVTAHQENKKIMAAYFKFWMFKEDLFTLSWARRIAPYKRPSLILTHPDRLIDIAKRVGPIQIILAGKAHPNDTPALKHLDVMMEKIDSLEAHNKIIKIALLENYDTNIGKFLTGSVDVWLNNPLPPFEASGTSGMKAILNGVIQLSTLDGWVVEAADKNIGKIFGYTPPDGQIGDVNELRLDEDSNALYDSLEELVTLYYKREADEREEKSEWVDMMINCVSEAGYFNTHRMVEEYKSRIWCE